MTTTSASSSCSRAATREASSSGTRASGSWRLDRGGDRTIGYRDNSIHLTRREYQLFARLAERSPGYTSAEQLLSEAWHDTGLPQETVRTYIVRLRRKLAELGAPVQVANRSRDGYSLVFDDQTQDAAYNGVS